MYIYHGLTLVAQTVKNLPAIWKTQVWSLGWEDSPREGNGYPLQSVCVKIYIYKLNHFIPETNTPLQINYTLREEEKRRSAEQYV